MHLSIKALKIIIVVSAVALGVLLLSTLFIGRIFMGFSGKAASAVTIIGGADGPTSVFLASKAEPPSMGLFLMGLLTGVIVCLSVLFLSIRAIRSKGAQQD